MTRFLAAELQKLRRPLVRWVTLVVLVLSCLLAWIGQVNANVQNPPPGAKHGIVYSVPTCQSLGLPKGFDCAEVQASTRAANDVARRQARSDSLVAKFAQQPLGAGRFAAGYLASLVGAGALFLVAAAHLGGEWTGRNIKGLLVQDPRRWRLLLAKGISLWIWSAGLLALTWLALAALSLKFKSDYNNSSITLSSSSAASTAAVQAGRALLVLAVYACVSLAAAVLTRNTLGIFFLGFGFILFSILAAGFAPLSRLTIAYWVTGWMHYQPLSTPADYLWAAQFPSAVTAPAAGVGAAGLLITALVTAVLAWRLFQRAEITG